ncbi:MAG: HlyC/CorC family transporter [Candidatus Omnitrophica bacterium]|nr:HlyC/CorC family transporter [Candidatus Omnitrophota bacterium]
MANLITLIISVLVLSGLCSMTEAAILSLPLIKARILFEQKQKGAKALLFIKENIHLVVGTIVILNNVINIMGSIFIGQMVTHIFGSRWLGVASALMAFAIIIISEAIPKTIGEHYKVQISLASAKPLHVLMWLLRPLVGILALATNPFRNKSILPKVTEEEIKIMLKLGRKAGTVETDEETLCNRVFKLNDLRASQMMKPIENIYALEANKSLSEIKEMIINSPYSRIAVYEKNISNIIGICQHRRLLAEIAKDNYNVKVKNFISRPIFVDENERADNLLEKFRAYHQHLFIVQNGKKQNIGILTMEDVLEELVGEIYNEKESAFKNQSRGF